MRRKKKVKMRVSFDPRVPLFFVVYVLPNEESQRFLASVRRVANEYGIKVDVKPIDSSAPTLLPALFVQGKYFFSYASNFSEQALRSFIAQARAKQEELIRKWVSAHRGRPAVVARPLYDTDGRDYPSRLMILFPGHFRLGFQRYETDEIGWEVTPYLLESLRDLGVDPMVYEDSGVGEFIIYTSVKTREE